VLFTCEFSKKSFIYKSIQLEDYLLISGFESTDTWPCSADSGCFVVLQYRIY